MNIKYWVLATFVFFTISIVELYFIIFPNCPHPGGTYYEKTRDSIYVSGVEVENRPQINADIQEVGDIEETTPEGTRIIDPHKTGEFPQWKELKVGMSKNEVRSLLGKPKIVRKGITEIWRYNYTSDRFGDVVFYKGKVITWLEPVITLYD